MLMTYAWLIPAIPAILLALVYLYEVRKSCSYDTLRFIKCGGDWSFRLMVWLIDRFTGRKGKLFSFYSTRLLRYSRISVESLLRTKIIIFLIALILALLVKSTNIAMETREILGRFDYRTDLLFRQKSVENEAGALKQEMEVFQRAKREIARGVLKGNTEAIQQHIRGLIQWSDKELLLPRDTIANKVYYRLLDYYSTRRLNILLYVFTAMAASFLPEAWIGIRNIFVRTDAKRELRFLKKLIIMNGSIPPVDFIHVLDTLVDKSKYYRRLLENIREGNRKNTVNTRGIYTDYVRASRDTTEKLFFEKLDQANNYDFRQAVVNIENEFRLEKREVLRNVKKRIEVIHVVGIMGFMVVIAIMVLYLIIPWMEMYNASQIGF